MTVNVTLTENKDTNNKITGFTANFTAVEGTYNSASTVNIDLETPVDSITKDEELKRLDINKTIKSLKDDLVSKGAMISKLTINL
jgi:hypothetical protein